MKSGYIGKISFKPNILPKLKFTGSEENLGIDSILLNV